MHCGTVNIIFVNITYCPLTINNYAQIIFFHVSFRYSVGPPKAGLSPPNHEQGKSKVFRFSLIQINRLAAA